MAILCVFDSQLTYPPNIDLLSQFLTYHDFILMALEFLKK